MEECRSKELCFFYMTEILLHLDYWCRGHLRYMNWCCDWIRGKCPEVLSTCYRLSVIHMNDLKERRVWSCVWLDNGRRIDSIGNINVGVLRRWCYAPTLTKYESSAIKENTNEPAGSMWTATDYSRVSSHQNWQASMLQEKITFRRWTVATDFIAMKQWELMIQQRPAYEIVTSRFVGYALWF